MIAAPRRSFSVSIPGRAPLVLGPRTLVMGVINVTPDSFSDGGKALDPAHALDIALAMEAAGADIIDVGAESTRPGAPPVSAHDEIARALPVLKAIAPRVKIPISIDTYKAATARVALDEGAAIVNDISAFDYDPELAPLVAERGVPAVLMHTRGRPDDMYAHADYKRRRRRGDQRPSAQHQSCARPWRSLRADDRRSRAGLREARAAEHGRARRPRSIG